MADGAAAGTDSAIDAFHNNVGVVRPVVGPVKAVASILILASGGSGGVQGPIIQIEASCGTGRPARRLVGADRFASPPPKLHRRPVATDEGGRIMDRVCSAGEAIVTNDMEQCSLLALSKRLGYLHFIAVDGEGRYHGMLRLDEVEPPGG